MSRSFAAGFGLLFCCMSLNAQTPSYPVSPKGSQVDNYHGNRIEDPYRWLEDDNSDSTAAWVKAQNEVTRAYLDKIPFRNKLRDRLTQMWNYPKYSAPFKEGDYYYFSKNSGLQNQSVMYRQKGLQGQPEVFLDPNTLSADGTAALQGMNFSKDGKYVVYSVARSGSDWQVASIMEVATKQLLKDELQWLKFGGFAWAGDGFYYSRYEEPAKDGQLSAQNQNMKVYYHKVGTLQSADQLVFEDPANPLRYVFAQTTEDERFLILNLYEGTSGAEIRYKDLRAGANEPFRVVIPGFDFQPSLVDNEGDRLLILTNHGAPNYKLISVDPANPQQQNWKTVIPEQKEVLESVATGAGRLFASYLKDASSRIVQYTPEGKQESVINLPGIGTASGFGAKRGDQEVFYTYTSFTYPPTIFRYDPANNRSVEFRRSEVKFNPADYETVQVFYPSRDGTQIPMFLTYKKGLKRNADNPVLLYGYGGFNVNLPPAFSISRVLWLDQGGIYAQANLRGGGEYGEAWHEAGMLDKKFKVFEDFIAAAEYLVREKYTNPGKIAIQGGSNGGLLVGACMIQRPDLFKVALPAVGVMDMLRYHKFTVGWGWVVEYGSSDKAEEFEYLIEYSPLHNLKAGVSYPATLVTTADHDDRVVPAHSFKFAATLQELGAKTNPYLIRIDTKAGHGAGKPTTKVIEEVADVYAFVMKNLGMNYKEK